MTGWAIALAYIFTTLLTQIHVSIDHVSFHTQEEASPPAEEHHPDSDSHHHSHPAADHELSTVVAASVKGLAPAVVAIARCSLPAVVSVLVRRQLPIPSGSATEELPPAPLLEHSIWSRGPPAAA